MHQQLSLILCILLCVLVHRLDQRTDVLRIVVQEGGLEVLTAHLVYRVDAQPYLLVRRRVLLMDGGLVASFKRHLHVIRLDQHILVEVSWAHVPLPLLVVLVSEVGS